MRLFSSRSRGRSGNAGMLPCGGYIIAPNQINFLTLCDWGVCFSVCLVGPAASPPQSPPSVSPVVAAAAPVELAAPAPSQYAHQSQLGETREAHASEGPLVESGAAEEDSDDGEEGVPRSIPSPPPLPMPEDGLPCPEGGEASFLTSEQVPLLPPDTAKHR